MGVRGVSSCCKSQDVMKRRQWLIKSFSTWLAPRLQRHGHVIGNCRELGSPSVLRVKFWARLCFEKNAVCTLLVAELFKRKLSQAIPLTGTLSTFNPKTVASSPTPQVVLEILEHRAIANDNRPVTKIGSASHSLIAAQATLSFAWQNKHKQNSLS